MRYSVIVPVHNEAAQLESLVNTFLASLPPAVHAILEEVLLVENGSRDGTLAVCRALERRWPRVVRVLSIGRGSYGEAIKTGMLESRGTHLSILECDFLDVTFVEESLACFRNGSEFLVGSKRHPRSIDARPLKRRLLTLGFNRLLNTLVGYPGSDTHGLKSIRSDLAKELCGLAVTTDEVFQTEIVLLAWRRGGRIEELPVRIREVRSSPVSIRRRLPLVLTMVAELRRSMRRFPRRAKTAPDVQLVMT
jgi:glycosyltransferase involved in cell wall biosynthesis